MSVAASRWALRYLYDQPHPRQGGLSYDARAVLIVLAAEARHPSHIAESSASYVGRVLGRHERNVRRLFDELAALAVVPMTTRPGKSALWHFLIPPMSTPRATDARGVVVHTPGVFEPDPGRLSPDVGKTRVASTYSYACNARAANGAEEIFTTTTIDELPDGSTWDDFYDPGTTGE